MEMILCADPLCCWTYTFKKQWQEIKLQFPHAFTRLYMGGLIPGWKNFHDETNAVSRPVQMGPVWMHAGTLAGKAIAHQIWMKDPPASSYPACLAVKAAGLQDESFAETLFDLLQETCLGKGFNIAKPEVIDKCVSNLAEQYPSFNKEKYLSDLETDAAKSAFRKDLDFMKLHHINRFPSIVVKDENKRTILIAGSRAAEEIITIINAMQPVA